MFGQKKMCIVGAGGSGRETLLILKAICERDNQDLDNKVVFMVKDEDFTEELVMGFPQITSSQFNTKDYVAVVAVGDSALRKKVVANLPSDTDFITLIHPRAEIAEDAIIGKGAVIASGVIIMCNVKIGDHCQLNLYTTVSHDCMIENYFTTAMDVTLSGNCIVRDAVYLGAGTKVKQGVVIEQDIVVGMGGIVVKSILEPGVYIGNPVKKMK